jgi:FtsZ-binding cell division protein ZapB
MELAHATAVNSALETDVVNNINILTLEIEYLTSKSQLLQQQNNQQRVKFYYSNIGFAKTR